MAIDKKTEKILYKPPAGKDDFQDRKKKFAKRLMSDSFTKGKSGNRMKSRSVTQKNLF